MSDKSSQGDGPSAAQPVAKMPRMILSRDLMGDDKVMIIRHEQEVYRLRITAAGKLILTKSHAFAGGSRPRRQSTDKADTSPASNIALIASPLRHPPPMQRSRRASADVSSCVRAEFSAWASHSRLLPNSLLRRESRAMMVRPCREVFSGHPGGTQFATFISAIFPHRLRMAAIA
jgi:hemin uptake protein HemP